MLRLKVKKVDSSVFELMINSKAGETLTQVAQRI